MFYLIPAEIMEQAPRKVANIHVSLSFVCKDDDVIMSDRQSRPGNRSQSPKS